MSRFAGPAHAPSPTRSESRRAAAVQPRPQRPWEPAQMGCKPAERARSSLSGLPERLQTGVEALSGLAMADVRVHRNSAEPAKLGALAFTKGNDIHLGPGQDRHLPHEAWHVVQQKQGRVTAQATTALGPISTADDLEAEADRMGPLSAAAGPTNKSNVALGHSRGSVLQAKLMRPTGVSLVREGTDSDTVRSLIDAEEEYLLRDDSDRRSDTVHVLEKKIYLLGETHGTKADRRWNEQTLLWSQCPRMIEEEPLVPGGRPFSQSELTYAATHPFDSIAAHFLIEGTKFWSAYKSFKQFSGQPNWETSPAVDDHLEYLVGWATTWFPRAFNQIEADPAIVWGDAAASTARQAKAAAFIDKFNPLMVRLTTAIRALAADLAIGPPSAGSQHQPPSDYPDTAPLKIAVNSSSVKEHLFLLTASAAFVPAMLSDLAQLLPSTPKEQQAVADVAGGSGYDVEQTEALAVDATFDLRNRAMLLNLEAGPRPVLVKTGSDHVTIIKNWFGEEAVAVSRLRPLSAATKRSHPLRGWQGKK